MLKYLNLTPGSVSPFGLINDKEREVTLVIDSDILKNEKLGFHPNINTQTLVMSTPDFLRSIEALGYEATIVEI